MATIHENERNDRLKLDQHRHGAGFTNRQPSESIILRGSEWMLTRSSGADPKDSEEESVLRSDSFESANPVLIGFPEIFSSEKRLNDLSFLRYLAAP